MLVDHVVVVEGTFVGEVVGGDGKAGREVDRLPVNTSHQGGVPGQVLHGPPEEASQLHLSQG